VMTSNREIGPSEGVVIVVIIGLRLCLISYAECPVEKGGSSIRVIAWLLPKELKSASGPFAELSIEELELIASAARAALALSNSTQQA